VTDSAPKLSTVHPNLDQLTAWLSKVLVPVAVIAAIVDLVRRMMELNLDLQRRLAHLQRARPRSETTARVKAQTQFAFMEVDEAKKVVPKTGPKEPKEKRSRKGVHPGRSPLPAHLERRPWPNPVPPKQRICPVCGSEMQTVGHRPCEYLEIEPAKLYVSVRMDETVACPHDDAIVSARVPAQLVDRGKLGLKLVVECLADRIIEHRPIESLARRLSQLGVPVPPNTLGSSVAAAMRALGPLVELIEARVQGPGMLSADASGVAVLDRDAPNGIRMGTMWCWANEKWVVFDYSASASANAPKDFLAELIQPLVQCDGTPTLSFIEKRGGQRPGCWAHARRGFVACVRSGERDAFPFIDLVSELAVIERQAKKAGDDASARLARRQKFSAPVLARIQQWVKEKRGHIPPKSPFGQALGYVHRQWSRLILFLHDGRVELTNNRIERELRRLAQGRKNWLFVWQDEGGQRLADSLSVVATALAHGLDPRKYLHAVLHRIVNESWPRARLAELLPDAIGALEPGLALVKAGLPDTRWPAPVPERLTLSSGS